MPAVETDFAEAVSARQLDRVVVHIQADTADLAVVRLSFGRLVGASDVVRLKILVKLSISSSIS